MARGKKADNIGCGVLLLVFLVIGIISTIVQSFFALVKDYIAFLVYLLRWEIIVPLFIACCAIVATSVLLWRGRMNRVADDSSDRSEYMAYAIRAAQTLLTVNMVSAYGILLFAVFSLYVHAMFFVMLLFLLVNVLVKIVGPVRLDYGPYDAQHELWERRFQLLNAIAQSSRVWRIMESGPVSNKKYSAGAENEVSREPCHCAVRHPFPFKSNRPAVCFQTGKETLAFFPDQLILIQGFKVGAVRYEDMELKLFAKRFIEHQGVPRDASVVGYTWQYVNKDGGPDLRFKNNPQMPICSYGRLEITADYGLHYVILFSKPVTQ